MKKINKNSFLLTLFTLFTGFLSTHSYAQYSYSIPFQYNDLDISGRISFFAQPEMRDGRPAFQCSAAQVIITDFGSTSHEIVDYLKRTPEFGFMFRDGGMILTESQYDLAIEGDVSSDWGAGSFRIDNMKDGGYCYPAVSGSGSSESWESSARMNDIDITHIAFDGLKSDIQEVLVREADRLSNEIEALQLREDYYGEDHSAEISALDKKMFLFDPNVKRSTDRDVKRNNSARNRQMLNKLNAEFERAPTVCEKLKIARQKLQYIDLQVSYEAQQKLIRDLEKSCNQARSLKMGVPNFDDYTIDDTELKESIEDFSEAVAPAVADVFEELSGGFFALQGSYSSHKDYGQVYSLGLNYHGYWNFICAELVLGLNYMDKAEMWVRDPDFTLDKYNANQSSRISEDEIVFRDIVSGSTSSTLSYKAYKKVDASIAMAASGGIGFDIPFKGITPNFMLIGFGTLPFSKLPSYYGYKYQFSLDISHSVTLGISYNTTYHAKDAFNQKAYLVSPYSNRTLDDLEELTDNNKNKFNTIEFSLGIKLIANE